MKKTTLIPTVLEERERLASNGTKKHFSTLPPPSIVNEGQYPLFYLSSSCPWYKLDTTNLSQTRRYIFPFLLQMLRALSWPPSIRPPCFLPPTSFLSLCLADLWNSIHTLLAETSAAQERNTGTLEPSIFC